MDRSHHRRESRATRANEDELPAIATAARRGRSLLLCASLGLATAGCSDSPAGGTDNQESDKPSIVQAKSEQPPKDKTPPAGDVSAEKTTSATSAEKQPAEPTKEYLADAGLPYLARRSDPVTHEVDFSVVVTPPYHTKVLKVWLPLPQSDAGQEISESELSTFPLEVTPQIAAEPVYGNRFAYFEFAQAARGADHPP